MAGYKLTEETKDDLIRIHQWGVENHGEETAMVSPTAGCSTPSFRVILTPSILAATTTHHFDFIAGKQTYESSMSMR